MSIIDTLITDRSAADLSELRSLLAVPFDQWTADQKEQFNLAAIKGAYNASDLNRVNDACLYLADKFRSYGYQISVELPEIAEETQEPVLPDGYTKVAYIQSSGTQYINTGFKPNQDTRLDMTIEVLTTPSSDWPFGVRKARGVDVYALMATNATSLTSWFGTASVTATVPTILQKVRINKDKTITTLTYDDGTVHTLTNTAATFQSAYSLFLLNINLAGTPASAYVAAKLYSCKIYDNGTLVRDYVPCIDTDGTAGLYDIVNSAFYANAGTGTLSAGDVVTGREVTTTAAEIRNYWKIGDTPQESHMKLYLQNVKKLRSVFQAAAGTPEVPETMDGLSVVEANNIEIILEAINAQLIEVMMAWAYSGEIYSGEV